MVKDTTVRISIEKRDLLKKTAVLSNENMKDYLEKAIDAYIESEKTNSDEE